MMFWIVCLALVLAVATPLAWMILRRTSEPVAAAAFDIAVYRDQLRDIDRDLARGVIEPDTAERTRLEISRRILDADKARTSAVQSRAPRAASYGALALVVALIAGGSLLTYRALGVPGYQDVPLKQRIAAADDLRANRPSQAEAEARTTLPPAATPDADYLTLVEQLRTKVAEQPDDPRGLQLLAQNEANLGNYTAAAAAQAQLLDVLGDQAPAQGYSELAEFYVLAAGGYVSPEAEAALSKALERDPHDGPARYYMASMLAQTGRPDLAFGMWRNLLEQSAPNAPWVAAIRAQLPQAAAQAGVNYTLPAPRVSAPSLSGPALSGPSADDVAAAQDMTAEDRQAMIESMVEGLAERLANDGGAASEWARLIGALGVLGQTDRAAAIYAEAQDVFAADPDGLTAIAAAATQAGVAP